MPKKKVFDNEKLRNFRKEIDYTQEEISVALGISTVTYQHWELGKREPKKHISKLTVFLENKGKKIDNFYYYKEIEERESSEKKKFNGELLTTLRKNLKLNQEDLAKIIGVHPSTISKWERSVQECPKKNIKKLCLIFEKQVEDFLIEEHKENDI